MNKVLYQRQIVDAYGQKLYLITEEELDNFEKALKDSNDIKDICNQYDVEFNLRSIREALFTFAQLKGEYGTNWGNYNKKLKAFEIIKESMDYDSFIKVMSKHYDNETINLLKEVLK